jgi:hypothetical protein
MTLELRKFHLIELLISLRNETVVSKIEVLRQERIKAYESSLKPMSVKNMQTRALASEKDIESGRGYDAEDLSIETGNQGL